MPNLLPARNAVWLLPLLLALAIVAEIASLLVGPAQLSLAALWAALTGHGDPIVRAILFQLRLPRALLGLLVGAMLGMGGASMQGYLRNPLADPGVLGVSGVAALGAVIAIYWQLATAHPFVLPLLAITGALLSLLPLMWLSRRGESTLSLILAGVAVATVSGAGINLALNLAPNPFAAMEITTWLLGSLEDRSFGDVWIALPCVVIGMTLLLWDGRALDALSLGEDAARTLGVDLARVRLRLMLGIAIGIGGVVAVAGSIGFVGLIVPHLVRPRTDRSPSAILIPSALAGAALLTLADLGTRLVPTSAPLKLGVLTAFLGVPVFLHYLLRERRLW
ncbi:iron ABC transporter permease [Sphingomonas sp. 10B4]|uniref:FecCD family ABC transporter permease n=1 Tax=Sphingomonas sp. 10B4 TaxID=3048575 RepID=UPI002AB4C6E3|nr:iron ABC transporter permease [Sphingomonas sp. 10B4]MDY7522860.1 iron ABC transporter permease [Sphingomonas sp. 10B4]MEB0284183.1 iron ABC transporter permease [Sphingomonas sp. 10B4]